MFLTDAVICCFLSFSMKNLPEVLKTAFRKKLREQGVAQREFPAHLKSLRYYPDFCYKHRHPPREAESLEPFLRKLASKRQSIERQRQAAASVDDCYALMKTWSEDGKAKGKDPAGSAWEGCYRRLKEEVLMR